jgi:hypothetical protein
MKSIILKALVLPVAAFALASAGAISTNTAKESKADVYYLGYIHNPTKDDCEDVDVNCSPGGGPACLSTSGFTAFDMNAAGKCINQLHRN